MWLMIITICLSQCVAFVIGIRLLIRNTTKNVVFVDEFIIIYFWESKIHKIEKYLLGILLNSAQTVTELKIMFSLKKWSS